MLSHPRLYALKKLGYTLRWFKQQEIGMPQHALRYARFLGPWLKRGTHVATLSTALIVLAGCATSGDSSTAAFDQRNQARDAYLARTQADPLGAYLASRDIVKTSNHTETASLAKTALTMLGIKYRFGGGAPSTGFDCSGLVTYAAEKSLGLKLPRQASEMARLGQAVKRNELRQGDLVFFNTQGHRFSHVGIYLGDQKFVHAPRAGSVVRVEDMGIAYWRKRYNGARRLVADNDSTDLSLADTPRLSRAQ